MDKILVYTGISLALSVDTFSVSLVVSGIKKDAVWIKESVLFAFVQVCFCILGVLLGESIVEHIGPYTRYFSFAIFLGLGLKMLFRGDEGDIAAILDRGGALSILILAVATSIDALGAGMAIGAGRPDLFQLGVILALITFTAGVLGNRIGGYLLSNENMTKTVGSIIFFLLAIAELLD